MSHPTFHNRNYLAVLVAVVLSGFGLAQTAAAQTARQGGMFYNPSFGRSFQPRPSGFGGGIETGASGNFLYPTRGNGTGFAAPWRPAPLPVAPVGQASAVERVLQMGPVGAAPQPANVGPATPVAVAPLAAPNPTIATQPANIPTVPQLGVPFGITVQNPAQNASISAAAADPYAYSPTLSLLMTRIARNKGVLAGLDIRVFVSNRLARIEGTVSTPRAETCWRTCSASSRA